MPPKPSSQPPIPKIHHPLNPKPEPNPRRSGPPSIARVSIPLHRMSDPAAIGTFVPIRDGTYAWPKGTPRFGDLVWGKVKSHPWWPGHVYSIDLIDNAEVHRCHCDRLILVAFFGDSSYGWFEPHEIVPLEENFAEKAAQGVITGSSFAAAVSEAVDEVARRAALGLLCPCRNPDAFCPHPLDVKYLIVDVPGFDPDTVYHPDQIAVARDRFVPRKALDYLLDAAMTQRDAAEVAASTLLGMEMAGFLAAYRRATFARFDDTYSEAFGVDPQKVRGAKDKEAAERRAQRARPLSGHKKMPTEEVAPGPSRRRGAAGGAAARLMEKILAGASALRTKATRKDQYLLKHRDPLPEPSPPAQGDESPEFGTDPPTPPLPGSTIEDKELVLQRRVPSVEIPPAAQATEGTASDAAAPKKTIKPNKAPKEATGLGAPADAAAGSDPKKKKKMKKLSDIDGGAAPNAPSAAGSVRPVAADPTKGGVKRGPSDQQAEMTVKKKAKLDQIKTLSNEKKAGGLEQKVIGAVAAGAARPAMKEKPEAAAGAARPAMKEKAEAAAKKKERAPAPRIKTPSSTALTMKFPQKSTLPSVPSLKARFARFGPLDVDSVRVCWKSNMCQVVYKFRSDAEVALKYARTHAMFGQGQVDPQYHIKEVEESGGEPLAPDAPPQRSDLRLMETAPFKPGTSGNDSPLPMSTAVPARAVAAGQQPKSILKKSTDVGGSAMREDSRAKFMLDTRESKLEPPPVPTSPGNGADSGAPIIGARSVGFAPQPPLQQPARTLQPPRRPTQQQLQPPRAAVTQPLPPLPYQARTSEGPQGQLPYPPRHADGPFAFSSQPSQQLPYPPRHADAPLAFSSQPSQQLLYSPRHNDGMSVLPGQPPLPYQYQPRSAGFLRQQQQPYPPRSGNSPLILSGQQQQQQPYPPRSGDNPLIPSGQPQQQQPYPPRSGNSRLILSGQPQQDLPPGPSAATDDIPAWKRSEKEFKDEVWRVMTGIVKMVEPLTDENGNFPYHLFARK